MRRNEPRLRRAVKTHPLYHLNNFPNTFPRAVGKEIIYLLATRKEPRLEGEDWEEIFARCIGAEWTPSNIGLDDVTLRANSMTWGAKTVKNRDPFNVSHIRLICGRNSLKFSFGIDNVHELTPDQIGEKVLQIWNKRVEEVRTRFSNVRTVVLIKGDDLSKISVYEEDTVQFMTNNYYWQWNENNNLEGFEKNTRTHRFSWQPHGSQFTVISDVPRSRLKIKIKRPPMVDPGEVLRSINYVDSWIEIVP